MQVHKRYYERSDTPPGSMARLVWDYANNHRPTRSTLYGRRKYALYYIVYDAGNHSWTCRYEMSCFTNYRHFTKSEVLNGKG